eukprot:6203952-Pleurochrysis_carterae.AAC.1
MSPACKKQCTLTGKSFGTRVVAPEEHQDDHNHHHHHHHRIIIIITKTIAATLEGHYKTTYLCIPAAVSPSSHGKFRERVASKARISAARQEKKQNWQNLRKKRGKNWGRNAG